MMGNDGNYGTLLIVFRRFSTVLTPWIIMVHAIDPMKSHRWPNAAQPPSKHTLHHGTHGTPTLQQRAEW